MKQLLIIILLIFIFQGCATTNKKMNSFSGDNDTLVIRTQKQKGGGLFCIGATNPDFKIISDPSFTYSVVLPDNVSDITRMQIATDYVEKNKNYIDIIKGSIDGKEVFAVDANNNHNFTDDSIYHIKPIKWYSSENSVKCSYRISNGQTIVKDSSWIDLGTQNNDLFYRRNEHFTANITIKGNKYEIAIADPASIFFNYSNKPTIALIKDNSMVKDTLLTKDILKKGEFVKLNNQHYRFADFSNNGEYLTLVRDKDFRNQTGLQTGMVAPPFKGITVAGKPINSENLHDKTIVIINSCECGGDKISTEAYYEIKKKYGSQVHVIRIDSKIEKSAEEMQIDTEDIKNKTFFDTYRGEYCSRTCYIINKNNRIEDKFESHKWKEYLAKKAIQ